MAVTAYLEKYFDCVDALPHDLQRHVTELREIEMQTSGLLEEVRAAREGLVRAREGGRGEEMKRYLLELQRCMLRFRETGNEKLEVTSEMLDTVASYTQQLMLKWKDLEAPRGGEDHHHSPRYFFPSSHVSSKGDSPLTMVIEGSHAPEKTANKRNHTSKRPRPVDKDKDKPTTPADEEGPHPREGVGRSRENSTSTAGVQGGLPGGKPPKKKVKIKKKPVKESGVFLPPTTPVPMPDLNSQPIEPDEPIYCLCRQVSFGEMIGCDNEECPIEWFHFQCVGLTSKPKGKWFCPKCSPERKPKNTK